MIPVRKVARRKCSLTGRRVRRSERGEDGLGEEEAGEGMGEVVQCAPRSVEYESAC
jgi:hypothetical protein